MTERKTTVTVAVGGTGQLIDVEIGPGTTARDVLDGAGLKGYWLSKPDGGGFFAAGDTLLDKVGNGQKLLATSPATVAVSAGPPGPALLAPVRQAISVVKRWLSPDDARAVVVHTRDGGVSIAQAPPTTVAASPGLVVRKLRARIAVQRQQLSHWQERGWTKDGKHYRGSYQTKYGAWSGLIEQRRSGLAFWIFDPPAEALRGQHGMCFTHKHGSKYAVHLWAPVEDVDGGIRAIEECIAADLERRTTYAGA